MSKAVLLSIRPEWCEKIASGRKTIEVRKTRPNLETPFKCYIYETYDKMYAGTGIWYPKEQFRFAHGCRKVIGEFVCDEIIDGRAEPQHWIYICENSMLSCQQIYSYCGEDADGNTKYCWGWHISDLVIYDKPKELSEFHLMYTPACNFSEECGGSNATECLFGITRPPQSWCYVEELT